MGPGPAGQNPGRKPKGRRRVHAREARSLGKQSSTLQGQYFRRRVMTTEDDTAMIAGQLAELTRIVEGMAKELGAMRERANSQQERADIQQERIDLAAQELTEVSARLQAAAAALRESV